MQPVPPPLNEHGRLAVNAADIADHLEYGQTSACVACEHSAIHWWRMPTGEYIPVHASCAHRLIEQWHERIETGDIDQPELTGGARAGAYARRATATGARVHPPRPRSVPSRSLGSPWFRPGMAEGTPWVLVSETSNGRAVELFTGRDHAEQVMRHTALLAAQGQPRSFGSPVAVGSVLLDPTGAVVDGWGEAFELDSAPRWPPMGRTQTWTTCRSCAAVLWPQRLVSADGRCRACVEAVEAADPRRWLGEPTDPGMAARPPQYGGPKRRKAAKEKAIN